MFSYYVCVYIYIYIYTTGVRDWASTIWPRRYRVFSMFDVRFRSRSAGVQLRLHYLQQVKLSGHPLRSAVAVKGLDVPPHLHLSATIKQDAIKQDTIAVDTAHVCQHADVGGMRPGLGRMIIINMCSLLVYVAIVIVIIISMISSNITTTTTTTTTTTITVTINYYYYSHPRRAGGGPASAVSASLRQTQRPQWSSQRETLRLIYIYIYIHIK